MITNALLSPVRSPRLVSHINNADLRDLTGNVVKEKPQGFEYKVHYDRRTRQWSVSTPKREHLIRRLPTSSYYYVELKPFRFLRDAIVQVMLLDSVI